MFVTTKAQPVLVTGCAGFIGFHLTKQLLDAGVHVVGVDVFLENQPIHLKHERLQLLRTHPNASFFNFYKLDVATSEFLELMLEMQPATVFHLAAQAGVRESITDPFSYAKNNLNAFLNVLEGCRLIHQNRPVHLLFASSSSVYGDVAGCHREDDPVNSPASFYAATKISNEHMAYSFSCVHGFRTTGMRFFTVYGPLGRPDMAPMLFADALTQGHTIELFNYGEQTRDFTYVTDVCDGILALAERQGGHQADIYNIGAGSPVELHSFVQILARALKREPVIKLTEARLGDVRHTHANTEKLGRDTGAYPKIPIQDGLHLFAEWYLKHHN